MIPSVAASLWISKGGSVLVRDSIMSFGLCWEPKLRGSAAGVLPFRLRGAGQRLYSDGQADPTEFWRASPDRGLTPGLLLSGPAPPL